MGCSWKAASAWKICSLITDINQRVQFSLVTLSLTISLLLLSFLPPSMWWFSSFTVPSVGIFMQMLFSRMKSLSCYMDQEPPIYYPHIDKNTATEPRCLCPAQTHGLELKTCTVALQSFQGCNPNKRCSPGREKGDKNSHINTQTHTQHCWQLGKLHEAI